jgi:hypothetical protein
MLEALKAQEQDPAAGERAATFEAWSRIKRYRASYDQIAEVVERRQNILNSGPPARRRLRGVKTLFD